MSEVYIYIWLILGVNLVDVFFPPWQRGSPDIRFTGKKRSVNPKNFFQNSRPFLLFQLERYQSSCFPTKIWRKSCQSKFCLESKNIEDIEVISLLYKIMFSRCWGGGNRPSWVPSLASNIFFICHLNTTTSIQVLRHDLLAGGLAKN